MTHTIGDWLLLFVVCVWRNYGSDTTLSANISRWSDSPTFANHDILAKCDVSPASFGLFFCFFLFYLTRQLHELTIKPHYYYYYIIVYRKSLSVWVLSAYLTTDKRQNHTHEHEHNRSQHYMCIYCVYSYCVQRVCALFISSGQNWRTHTWDLT